jgi:hypothetical protein
MKKQTVKIFMILNLLILLIGTTAYSQIPGTRITANVPFAFYVGDTRLPAGEYYITRVGNNPDVLLIRSKDNQKADFFIVENAQSNKTPTETDLVFKEIGDAYFLSKIWTVGNDVGAEIPTSHMERKLEKNLSSNQGIKIVVGS